MECSLRSKRVPTEPGGIDEAKAADSKTVYDASAPLTKSKSRSGGDQLVTQPFLIYGANGFTGRLVAQLAKQMGLSPILAGRNGDAVSKLAAELGFSWRCFDVNRPDLQGIRLVLSCAGPFSRTAPALIAACVSSGVHYLDITGEMPVFELAHSLNGSAREKGITLMPGVGFDVVPTDCVSLLLKEAVPDATHLELALMSQAALSVGTVKTMIENIPSGGRERINGELVEVPLFHKTQCVQFSSGVVQCAAIPWADLLTAYYTTQIPNIVVYAAQPRGAIILGRALNPIRRLLGRAPAQSALKRLVDTWVRGPTLEQRETARVEIWGRARGPRNTQTVLVDVPEGYRFTASLALACVRRVIESGCVGYLTPAQAFGSQFLFSMAAVKRIK